jgi:BMFP domain-containing protein YqiC
MTATPNEFNASTGSQSFAEQIKELLGNALPSHLGHLKTELLDHLSPALEHQLRHLGLVTQAEFDAQKTVLARTRQLLADAMKRLDALEQQRLNSSD